MWSAARVWVLIGFGLLLLFNNCGSPVRFGAASDPSASRMDSGNGSGYGGKPDGRFYHLVPEFTCERQEAAMGVIAITQTSITYIENNRLQCDSARSDINADLIDNSPFHNLLVGYEDMIFERKDADVTRIPDRLVEAWCFDHPTEKNFEIIAQYNRASRTATSTLFRTRANPAAPFSLADLPVSRLVGHDSVHYQGVDYDLLIDKAAPSRIVGQFNAVFKGMVDGDAVEIGMNCRLGGYLDAHLWPARALSTEAIFEYEFLSLPDQIFAVSEKSSSKRYLSRIDLPLGSETALTPTEPPGRGVDHMVVNRPGDRLLYSYDDSVAYASRLFSMSLTGGTATPLSDALLDPGQQVYDDFYITRDGKWAYYKDGVQENVHFGDVEQWLRAVPTDGSGPPRQITHSLPLGGDYSVYDFVVSEDQGRVAYRVTSTTRFGGYEIWSVRMDGSGDFMLSPPPPPDLPFTATYLPLGVPMVLVGSASQSVVYHIMTAVTEPAFSSTNVSHISRLDGSGTDKFSGYMLNHFGREAGARYLYFSAEKLGDGLVYDADLRRSVKTPFYSSVSSLGGARLLGVRADEIHLIDGETGAITPICKLRGTANQIYKSASGTAFVTATTASEILVYEIESGACTELSGVPRRPSTTTPFWYWYDAQVEVAPDGQSLLVIADVTGEGGRDLIWLPADGRAPIKVNVPVSSAQSIYGAHFTSDSRAIVYQGNQIRSAKPMLFLWRLPN